MDIFEKIYNSCPIIVQNILLNAKATQLYYERYGEKFWKIYNEFLKNQFLQENDIIDLQNYKLRKIVKHAYNTVPYYNSIMKISKITPNDIKSKNDLFKLPILTKDKIIQNYDKLISSEYKKKLRYGHTSGTTGSPLDICYDIQTCVVHHAADWRQKKWAGLEYGQPYASIQGRLIVPIKQKRPPFWRMNYINNQLFLSSFHLTDENIPYYFHELNRRNIHFLEGYPSNIYILARYLNKNRIIFPLKAILTSSETLFDFQKYEIEKAFTCKIFDFYSMAERVIYASECNNHSGHHLNLDYGITEFLDRNNENLEYGVLGNIIATSLHNFAMPLIRYKTNDSSVLKIEKCACGCSFPLMDDVATKNESIITLSDGRLLSPSVLTHPFKPLKYIVKSQIIQNTITDFEIKLVTTSGFTRNDELKLLDGFKERLGSNIKVKISYLDDIPNSKNGKFRWVISNINLI